MKQLIKAAVFTALTLAFVFVAAGCGNEATPYDTNNADHFTVSVKYDANGGLFTTNTSVIVDSYNAAQLKADGNTAAVALLPPDADARGNDAFSATKNGHFLAGWYKERTEVTDANGNVQYTYSGKWDFQKDRLTVDVNGTYRAEEPVMTLYAAWIPLFEVAVYSQDSGELLKTLTYDPTSGKELRVPRWNEESGAVEMYDFPERSGYTFDKAYYDQEGKTVLDTETVIHPGVVDYETGTAKDGLLNVYVAWTEGEWYRIYTAEQFLENASVSGNYEIFADLDFAEEIWPTSLMYGNFSGRIRGNGHTFKNITLEQTNNSKVNAGLFGNVTETAVLSDVTFENVTFTIKAGTRVVGTGYGLLAGTLSSDATIENVAIRDSALQIDSACYFGVDDYAIGLVCGMGDASVVKDAQITCAVVGDNPENWILNVNGNTVTVDSAE